MELQVYLAFFVATFIFMIIPGPNVALIVANSIAHGMRSGIYTVFGTCSAMVVQIALIGLGITGAASALGDWIGWIRWLGIFYLIYLGVKQWSAPAAANDSAPLTGSAYGRGFLVSFVNPQTIAFYAAFFPQFVKTSQPIALQMLIMGATFVVLAFLIDGSYAVVIGLTRFKIANDARLRNRVSGALLIVVALALALARTG
ncbi:MAG TPA: LysE family translocator [Micropepsaceae bacterium]|nr:LysE family translocator [Micropepsaceae bacterium]